ncbi:unnamed protein product, partial [Brenthis ino]
MDSDHETLLFHTEVRWLSKGNMLGRLYEHRAELWLGKIGENNYSAFATLKAHVEDKKYDASKANIQDNIKSHLQMLIDEFNRYFPEYTEAETKDNQKIIRNPFSTDAAKLIRRSSCILNPCVTGGTNEQQLK